MKKLLSLILALMMLMLPVLSIAEEADELYDLRAAALEAGRKVETALSISGLPKGLVFDEQTEEVVYALVEAIALSVTQQGDEGGVNLLIDGNSVLNLSGAASGDDLYLNSNLLGGTVVISGDEAIPLTKRLVNVLALAGLIPEDDAQGIITMIDQVEASVREELEQALASVVQVEAAPMPEVDASALTEAFAPLTGKITTEPVTMQPKNADPAANVTTLTITPDELKACIKAIPLFIKENPALVVWFEEQMAANSVNLAAEGENVNLTENGQLSAEFAANLDEVIAELDAATLSRKDVVIKVYTNEAGETVLANAVYYIPLESEYDAASAEDAVVMAESQINLPMEMSYVRLTTAQGVTHTAQIILSDGASTISATANAIDKENGLYLAFDMLVTDEMAFGFSFDCTTNHTAAVRDTDTLISFYMEEDDEERATMTIAYNGDFAAEGVDYTGKETIVVSLMGMPVVTISLDHKSGDPDPSIMSGDVVRPMELNDVDFASWFTKIYETIVGWPGVLIAALPEDVMVFIVTMLMEGV